MKNDLLCLPIFFLVLILNFSARANEDQGHTSEVEIVSSDVRWIPTINLGTIRIQSDNPDSNVDQNLDPQLSFDIQSTWESQLVGDKQFIQYGFALFFVGSELKADPESDLSLSYLVFPIALKYNLEQQAEQKTQIFLKGGLSPALLIGATVSSCKSAACGFDSDVDLYFRESRSVKTDFQQYQLLASVAIGFELPLFKDFIIDSMGLIGDLSYTRSIGKLNKTNAFGRDLNLAGISARIGFGLDF